jgi:hypothetical protein
MYIGVHTQYPLFSLDVNFDSSGQIFENTQNFMNIRALAAEFSRRRQDVTRFLQFCECA